MVTWMFYRRLRDNFHIRRQVLRSVVFVDVFVDVSGHCCNAQWAKGTSSALRAPGGDGALPTLFRPPGTTVPDGLMFHP